MSKLNLLKNGRQKPEEKNDPAQQRQKAPVKLSLMITIVDKTKAEYYADLIQSYEANVQFIALAKGTAKEQTLEYLGLSGNEKVVIFSIIKSSKADDISYTLERKFKTIRNGKGVAVTIPFTSMIGTTLYTFLCNE